MANDDYLPILALAGVGAAAAYLYFTQAYAQPPPTEGNVTNLQVSLDKSEVPKGTPINVTVDITASQYPLYLHTRILDSSNNVITHNTFSVSSTPYNYTIDTSNLNAGRYTLEISDNEQFI